MLKMDWVGNYYLPLLVSCRNWDCFTNIWSIIDKGICCCIRFPLITELSRLFVDSEWSPFLIRYQQVGFIDAFPLVQFQVPQIKWLATQVSSGTMRFGSEFRAVRKYLRTSSSCAARSCGELEVTRPANCSSGPITATLQFPSKSI